LRRGSVFDRSPKIRLIVKGQSSSEQIEFTIDTGFDGHIALPFSVIDRISAIYDGNQTIRLADGSFGSVRRYIAAVDWNDKQKEVDVLALFAGSPLLGVEMLAETLMTIEMTDGGGVIIEDL
jgi:clan AA aspartic protease